MKRTRNRTVQTRASVKAAREQLCFLDKIIYSMATPAESFLSFYERSEQMNGSIYFSEYFRETFTNQ